MTTSAEVPIKKTIVLADGGDRKLSHLPYRKGALHGVTSPIRSLQRTSDTFFAADRVLMTNFLAPQDWIEVRQSIALSHEQGLVWRWLQAHKRLIEYRSYQESIASASDVKAHKFWYATKNRILIALTLTEASIRNVKLSKREIGRRSNLSLPTVIEVLRDAAALGLIDEDNQLSKDSLDFISDKVVEIISSDEFRLLGEAIRSFHLSREVPVDPFNV